MKHQDSDPVVLSWSVALNDFSVFRDQIVTGCTWGEWRAMDEDGRDEMLMDKKSDVISMWVVDDEE